MEVINFYRGSKEDYNLSLHKAGIYFTTDTLEILHNGNSFAYSPAQSFVKDALAGVIKSIKINDSGKLTYLKIGLDSSGNIIETLEIFPVALEIIRDEEGNIVSLGQDGLMSAQDKTDLTKLQADENTEGSIRNLINESWAWWEEIPDENNEENINIS